MLFRLHFSVEEVTTLWGFMDTHLHLKSVRSTGSNTVPEPRSLGGIPVSIAGLGGIWHKLIPLRFYVQFTYKEMGGGVF